MITVAVIALVFAFFAGVCGFNGTAALSLLIAVALVAMRFLP